MDIDDKGVCAESFGLQGNSANTKRPARGQQNGGALPVIGEHLPGGTLGQNHNPHSLTQPLTVWAKIRAWNLVCPYRIFIHLLSVVAILARSYS